jgi:hypothetical protein
MQERKISVPHHQQIISNNFYGQMIISNNDFFTAGKR